MSPTFIIFNCLQHESLWKKESRICLRRGRYCAINKEQADTIRVEIRDDLDISSIHASLVWVSWSRIVPHSGTAAGYEPDAIRPPPPSTPFIPLCSHFTRSSRNTRYHPFLKQTNSPSLPLLPSPLPIEHRSCTRVCTVARENISMFKPCSNFGFESSIARRSIGRWKLNAQSLFFTSSRKQG